MSNKVPHKGLNEDNKVQRLPIEVALLIYSAQHKGINVPKWLSANKLLKFHDFCTKFISLELITGIQENVRTKFDLEQATSKSSVMTILELCGRQKASNGNFQYVDVASLISLCKLKLDLHFGTQSAGDQTLTEPGRAHSPQMNTSATTDTSMISQVEHIPQTLQHTSGNSTGSAPTNKTVSHQLNDINQNLLPPPQSTIITLSSKGNLSADSYSIDRFNTEISRNAVSTRSSPTKYNRTLSTLKPSSNSPVQQPPYPMIASQPTPTHTSTQKQGSRGSKPPRVRSSSHTSHPRITNFPGESNDQSMPGVESCDPRAAAIDSTTLESTGKLSARSSVQQLEDEVTTTLVSSATERTNKGSPELSEVEELRLWKFKVEIETALCRALRHADQFHMLQVYLGFLGSHDQQHTFFPARGPTVVSTPREWITKTELNTALLAAQLRFTDVQLGVFIVLLQEFAIASQFRQAQENQTKKPCMPRGKWKKKKNMQSIEKIKTGTPHKPAHPIQTVVNDENKINSLWLQRYLISLRLVGLRNHTQLLSTNPFQQLPTTTSTQPSSNTRGRGRDGARDPSVHEINRSRSQPKYQPVASSNSTAALKPGSRRSKSVSAPSSSSRLNNRDTATNNLRPKTSVTLLGWSEWRKLKDELQRHRSASKFNQFTALLKGIFPKHRNDADTLTDQEISSFLEQYSIMPLELFEREISIRIQFWLHDYDGRKDYCHQFNKSVKAWEIQTNSKLMKLLPKQRSEISNEIRQKLIQSMYNSLILSEKKSAKITKELFANFDSYNRDLTQPRLSFGTWLKKYVDRQESKLQKLIEINKSTIQQTKEYINKRTNIAPYDEVIMKLRDSVQKLSVPECVLLEKSLTDIKKENAENIIINSLQFEKTLQRYNLSVDSSQVLRESAERIFQPISAEEAYSHHHDIEYRKKLKWDEDFQKWKERKSQEKLRSYLDQENSKREKVEASAARSQLAENEFQSWINTHKNNKYISKVDGKEHPLPLATDTSVHHTEKWHDLCDKVSHS